MKARLQASLGQHLVMTPQLQQAIRLLQLSAIELEAEMTEAVETNPLLEWDEDGPGDTPAVADAADDRPDDTWAELEADAWQQAAHPFDDGIASLAEQVAETETLHDHLLWQLHLSPVSARDRDIGVALIEAIGDDGYLREPLDAIAASLPEPPPGENEILAVLHRIQQFDPVGVGARTLSECLRVQLGSVEAPAGTVALAREIADGLLERLPRLGAAGIATELCEPIPDVQAAIALLLSLDPRPGARLGGMPADAYIRPDVVIRRHHGRWRADLAERSRPRLRINRGYAAMIGSSSSRDAAYLRGHLQEARWLLRNLEARGATLLRVARCLAERQRAFLDHGPGGLRPLTLREVAAELGLHESTVSRAIARKYARTPRGTIALRAFFASGVGGGTGEETSSTAVQSMIRELVSAENPRRPLSDARLAEMLQASGVPVARRTVAKYREAMSIPASQARVRMA